MLTTAASIILLAGGALTYWLIRRKRTTTKHTPNASEKSLPDASSDASAPYSNDAIQAIRTDCYRLAFGVARIDYQILGEHSVVLASVETSMESAVHQPEFFPRRPMLLPKLLRAINDSDSTRSELVKLIVGDPSLAGSVLQRANSAYYRLTPAPVDSLDRAVVHLGLDGLRSLVGTAILQPVFRLPQGFFDKFAELTWEQAQRSAAAAEAYAKTTRSCDPFIAQLLGLVGSLANIVLFRLTLQKYRENPNIMPRAEVFIRAMQLHGEHVSRLIATTWELSDLSITALNEQERRLSPTLMSPLGKAVYFGSLCGALSMLVKRNAFALGDAQALLLEQGLEEQTADAIWQAAIKAQPEESTSGR